jgi:CPA2 family monovalent cation:H+ antiporter-2
VHNTLDILQDLAVVMIVAGLVTVLFHRFKQPVVLGYIIAGVIIGPHTPPFPLIKEEHTIHTFSELGVILLMFSLGLEFSLRKLKQVGVPAVIAAFVEILLMAWVGYEIGRLFGWSTMDSVFLGAILSISSTTIIIKALGELGKSKERFAQLIFGILIIEDILGIAMIALLSGIAMTGTLGVVDIGLTLGRLGVFLAVVLVAGLIAVPRLLGYVARFKSNEMLLITVLALCFGVSLLASKLGYSVALGAFIIGAVIAEAREIHRIEHLIEPVRDMFSAVFFVAIGLLIDPKMLVTHWLPILVITLAVVVGKVVSCAFGSFVGGNDTRTSLRVGMGLAQIGEFSFIIAALGMTLKVTSGFLYPIAVAVSAVTTLLTPYFIKSADGFASYFDRRAPRSFVNALGVYTNWVGALGQRHPSMSTRLIRRWFAQMGLNAALIAGVFIAAAYVGKHPTGWMLNLKLDRDWLQGGLWLAAAILSLPMSIATIRKLQALGLLIAETKVSEAAAGKRTPAIRAIVAQFIPIAGTVILGLYIIVLSSTLLPTFEVFLVLLVLVLIITWLLRRSFIRVYSKAQVALEETFAQPPPTRPVSAAPFPPLLHEANLERVPIAAESAAAGRLIRELQLRAETGASIVGIERPGANIINPGPDEELQQGDQVLLLGTRAQLDSAKNALSKPLESGNDT